MNIWSSDWWTVTNFLFFLSIYLPHICIDVFHFKIVSCTLGIDGQLSNHHLFFSHTFIINCPNIPYCEKKTLVYVSSILRCLSSIVYRFFKNFLVGISPRILSYRSHSTEFRREALADLLTYNGELDFKSWFVFWRFSLCYEDYLKLQPIVR